MKKLFSESAIKAVVIVILAVIVFLGLIGILKNKFKLDELQFTINTIIAIATLCILALTLQTNNRNNKLFLTQNEIMLAQVTYESFLPRISNIIESGKGNAIPNTQLVPLKVFSEVDLKDVQKYNYIDRITPILKFIHDSLIYKKYITQFGENAKLSFDEKDHKELIGLCNIATIVNMGFISTQGWINEVISLYETILHTKNLKKPHKEQLFVLLDDACKDYIKICELNIEYNNFNSNTRNEFLGKSLLNEYQYLTVKRLWLAFDDDEFNLKLFNELAEDFWLKYEELLLLKTELLEINE